MKKILLLAALFSITNSFSQDKTQNLKGSLEGQILDLISNNALKDAEIFIFQRNVDYTKEGLPILNSLKESKLLIQLKSDDNGRFHKELPLKNDKDYFNIKIQYKGKETLYKNIIPISNGEKVELVLKMTPKNPNKDQENKIEYLLRNEDDKKNQDKMLDYENQNEMIKKKKEEQIQLKSSSTSLVPQSLCSYLPIPTNVFVSNLHNGYNGSATGSGFTGLINFDDYVGGVVQGEIGSITANIEVKKAQAVAARTFSMNRHLLSLPVNVGQAYHDTPSATSLNSSLLTTEQIILYNGNVIDAKYAARCNGDYTQNADAGTWSPFQNCNTTGTPIPYLLSRPCSGHINCSQTSETPCCNAPISTSNVSGYIFGHGVGLCQRGIEQWGEIYNLNYCEMLHRYYTDVCIGNSDCDTVSNSLDCSNAIPISCGETYQGASSTAPSNVDAFGCNTWTEAGPERVHIITVPLNGTLTASLSNYTGDLDVYILGSCDPSDCLGTVSSDSATFANAQAGATYYIVVDADDGSGSAYDLFVDCPVPTLDCSNVVSLSCGVTYQGGSSTAPSNIDSFGCNNWTESGPERVHTITPTTNGIITASLSNYTGDLDVYILGSCDPLNCLGTVSSDSATFTNALAGVTYYIVVDADDGSGSAYDLVVDCTDIPTLDCSNAVALTCGVTYQGVSSTAPSNVDTFGCNSWTETGPERVHTITPTASGTITASLSNYTGDLDVYILGSCDPLNCLGTVSSDSATFTNALAGVTYYIVVDADDGSGSAYDLVVDCPTTNLDCGNAVALTCGVTYQGASSTAPSNVDTFGCNSWTETGPERVHTITPTTSGTITASLSNYTGDLDVYILGSCDPSDCLGTVSSDSATFANALAGVTYYIVVDADDGSGSAYDLVVDCPVTTPNEDITVTNVSVTPITVAPNSIITVSANQNYTGNQLDINLPSFDLDYYLSTDCNLSGDDILLGGDASDLGSNNPTYLESEDVTIPSNMNSGIYFVIFAADNDGELIESDENNNTACIQITINKLAVNDFNFKESITLYPNPTESEIFIKTEQTIHKAILFNVLGAKVAEFNVKNNKMNIANHSSGTYFLTLIDSDNSNQATFKIIKK